MMWLAKTERLSVRRVGKHIARKRRSCPDVNYVNDPREIACGSSEVGMRG